MKVKELIKAYIIHRLGGKTNEEYARDYYSGKRKGAEETISTILQYSLNIGNVSAEERLQRLAEYIMAIYTNVTSRK